MANQLYLWTVGEKAQAFSQAQVDPQCNGNTGKGMKVDSQGFNNLQLAR